jgi:hypothetical protein
MNSSSGCVERDKLKDYKTLKDFENLFLTDLGGNLDASTSALFEDGVAPLVMLLYRVYVNSSIL